MQRIRNIFKSTEKDLITVILTLFILHFLSVHGVANSLILCFEEDGDVNVESVAGSFMTIPSEDLMHSDISHNHTETSFNISHTHHSDVAFSTVCSKEQRTTRYDQQRTLAYLDGILNSAIAELPRSRVFQLTAFIPPLIEDFITTNLQTVVLLN